MTGLFPITYADLQGMWGGAHLRSTHRTDVETGLPSLNAAMQKANINTPRRVAAFLTTLAFESMLEYNIDQFGATSTYHGRGYIQLTGSYNYDAAGKYLGVDLLVHPELAKSLDYSARIATWYWRVARPNCNYYADNLLMGRIDAAIGYPYGDGSADKARCAAFGAALKYLTGSTPAGINCSRTGTV